MHQPTAEDALSRLAPLVGEWSLAMTPPGGPPWPVRAHASIAWHPSGALLEVRSTVDVDWAPDAVSVIGCDAANGTYTQLYTDDRGVCRTYAMTMTGREWTLRRDGDPFPQRFAATISDDGATIAGRWEKALDGGSFEIDFDIVYRREA